VEAVGSLAYYPRCATLEHRPLLFDVESKVAEVCKVPKVVIGELSAEDSRSI